MSHYNLSLREIERSLTNYSLVHSITKGKLQFEYQYILVYLSIIKVIYHQEYYRVSNEDISYKELIDKTYLEDLQDEYWLQSYQLDGHCLKFLLRCCLSSKEEIQTFIDDNVENPQLKQQLHSHMNRSILKQICTWVNTFNTN